MFLSHGGAVQSTQHQTNDEFEVDPFPGKPKILFVGLVESSHTHSWINLLENSALNVRLFAMPTNSGGEPLESSNIRTYLSTYSPQSGLDPNRFRCLYPTPEERENAEKKDPVLKLRKQFLKLRTLDIKKIGIIRTAKELLAFAVLFCIAFISACVPSKKRETSSLKPKAFSPEAWFTQIIEEWQPDIIHTLGLYDNQGGLFYYAVRQKFKLESYGKWVLQLRGGSDLTLRRHQVEFAEQISSILCESDWIISDNLANIKYVEQLGGAAKKFADINPVPGTGGVEVDELRTRWESFPSQRERIILWPKAYDCKWSLALPVFEALKLAWEQIKPCKIFMLFMIPDTREWYNTLPQEIRECCVVHPQKIPRTEVFNLMTQSRVLFAPSLVDGVPNSLYEAMACGAFPILSPLETITPVVEHENNVLFARNLYPQEIADALVRAMNDDALVDRAVANNLQLVRKIADRNKIRSKVLEFYQGLC